MKRMLSTILFVILIAGLVGCGATENKQTSGTETTSSSSSNNNTIKENIEANKQAEEKKKQEEEAQKKLLQQQKYALLAKESIPLITENNLELQEKSFNFITKNYKLFPAKTDSDVKQVKKMTDTSITAKHLNKNVMPYLEKMVSFQGTVVTIEETPIENNETITLIHVMDDNMQSYQILMFKSVENVFEGDNIRFWGTPVGPSSFDNVSGGTTNVQVLIGSNVEKL